ncbi:hypothetical protein HDU79_006222 [Rhizoclosmatium sp. JEL0117]|nr:hypothetical protein HDU79_006222 [Rhizoclosmatium sp. JEL0117]
MLPKSGTHLNEKLLAALIEIGEDRKDGFVEVLELLKHCISQLVAEDLGPTAVISLPDLLLAFNSASSNITSLVTLVSKTIALLESLETSGSHLGFLKGYIVDIRRTFAKLKIEFATVCLADESKKINPTLLIIVQERGVRVGRLVVSLWLEFKEKLLELHKRPRGSVTESAPVSQLLKQMISTIESGMTAVDPSIIVITVSALIEVSERVAFCLASSELNVTEDLFLLDATLQELATQSITALIHQDAQEIVEHNTQRSFAEVFEVAESLKSSVRTGKVIRSRTNISLLDTPKQHSEASIKSEETTELAQIDEKTQVPKDVKDDSLRLKTVFELLSGIADSSTRDMILRTWSTFSSANNVASIFVERFETFLTPSNYDSRLEILAFLIDWIRSDHLNIIEPDNGVKKTMLDFTSYCYGALEEDLVEFGLLAKLEEVIKNPRMTSERKESLPMATARPGRKAIASLLQTSANSIAEQLTVIDFKIYKRITASEMLDSSVSKPNLLAFQHRFNFVVGLVSTTVIKYESPKLRALMIAHYIMVAKKCYELKSLNSGLAIVSALTSASIYRLKMTWAKVCQGSMQDLEELKSAFSHQNNWKGLRSIVSTTNKATLCIPYLGIYAHDIIFIKETQDKMIDGRVNVTRCRHLQKAIASALNFQSANCTIIGDVALQEVLTVEKGLFITQSSLFAASLLAEKRL